MLKCVQRNINSLEAVMQLLRIRQVCDLTGLSRSTVYDLMSKGRFPASVRLTDRLIAWRSEDISIWQESRPFTRDIEKSRLSRKSAGNDMFVSKPVDVVCAPSPTDKDDKTGSNDKGTDHEIA